MIDTWIQVRWQPTKSSNSYRIFVRNFNDIPINNEPWTTSFVEIDTLLGDRVDFTYNLPVPVQPIVVRILQTDSTNHPLPRIDAFDSFSKQSDVFGNELTIISSEIKEGYTYIEVLEEIDSQHLVIDSVLVQPFKIKGKNIILLGEFTPSTILPIYGCFIPP